MKLKLFQKAKKLAINSDHPKYQLGAIIVDKRGKILSSGFNQMKTHTKSNSYKKRLHAEVAAILACKGSIEGCSLYVYRGLKNGSNGLSRPCKYCMEIIRDKGIKEVYYTTERGYECYIVEKAIA